MQLLQRLVVARDGTPCTTKDSSSKARVASNEVDVSNASNKRLGAFLRSTALSNLSVMHYLFVNNEWTCKHKDYLNLNYTFRQSKDQCHTKDETDHSASHLATDLRESY
jgi:hypothetical protein